MKPITDGRDDLLFAEYPTKARQPCIVNSLNWIPALIKGLYLMTKQPLQFCNCFSNDEQT